MVAFRHTNADFMKLIGLTKALKYSLTFFFFLISDCSELLSLFRNFIIFHHCNTRSSAFNIYFCYFRTWYLAYHSVKCLLYTMPENKIIPMIKEKYWVMNKIQIFYIHRCSHKERKRIHIVCLVMLLYTVLCSCILLYFYVVYNNLFFFFFKVRFVKPVIALPCIVCS